jgi:hypothetical protein
MRHLLFDSATDLQVSFGPHAETIIEEIPNYTNAEPTIQISEVNLYLQTLTVVTSSTANEMGLGCPTLFNSASLKGGLYVTPLTRGLTSS